MTSYPVKATGKYKTAPGKTKKKKAVFYRFSPRDLIDFAIPHFRWAWAAVFVLVLADSLWLCRTWLIMPSPWWAFAPFLLLLNIKLLYYLSPAMGFTALDSVLLPFRKNRIDSRIFLAAEYFALCLAATHAMEILTYLVCALNYPLVDQQLDHIDKILGFEWRQWFLWSSKSSLHVFLQLGYMSMIPQLGFLMIWFAGKQDTDRLYETFWALLLALIITTVISGLWPTLGPAYVSNWPQDTLGPMPAAYGGPMRDVLTVRAGISPDFTIHRPTGIITFPSFHTICAIISSYAFRRTGFAGYIILFINIVMLVSIPFVGNHYLSDMVAGAFIALLSIAATGVSRRRAKSPVLQARPGIRNGRRPWLSLF